MTHIVHTEHGVNVNPNAWATLDVHDSCAWNRAKAIAAEALPMPEELTIQAHFEDGVIPVDPAELDDLAFPTPQRHSVEDEQEVITDLVVDYHSTPSVNGHLIA